MARIAGVDLPNDKRVEYALPYIFGIGLTLSREILAKTGINPDTRVRDLTEGEVAKIREVVDRDYRWKATSAVRNPSTSNAWWKLAATVAEGIAPVCLCAARIPKTTPVPARVPKRARAKSNQQRRVN